MCQIREREEVNERGKREEKRKFRREIGKHRGKRQKLIGKGKKGE